MTAHCITELTSFLPPMSLAKIEKACFWLFQESLIRVC